MESATNEVLALERRFWEEGTPELFRLHFADEGMAVFEPMGVIDKPGSIAMASRAKPFFDVKIQDVHIHEITPECITLTYHGEGRREGDEEPYRGSLSSVYVRRDGRWQMAMTVHQPWNPDKPVA